jgi:hypothetical protein
MAAAAAAAVLVEAMTTQSMVLWRLVASRKSKGRSSSESNS